MTTKTIKIQYLDDSIPKLTYIGGKSDWIDLAAAETVTLKAGEFKLIHLGVAMKLPEGYEAHIAPRSSTFKNFGILQANSVGVVDSSYCGANDWWKMPVYATRDVTIEKGFGGCFVTVVYQLGKSVKFFGGADLVASVNF